MIKLPQGYCIDSTEVTRDQYALWLATNPLSTGQLPECAWNTAFTPDATCMGGAAVCQGAACGKHPQVCVDWCDAYAFCKAVGKRLCGKIGGGTNLFADFTDAAKSQWFNACTSNAQNDYPYGDTYDGQACDGMDKSSSTVPSGSLTGCQSAINGYAGVFDLSGNVYEWEDSCTGVTGSQDYCRLRGGSFGSANFPACLRCDGGTTWSYWLRQYNVDWVGFRCCAEP
jgi:formylglycine-generating enzyme